MEVDHIIPKEMDGSDGIYNLQLLHRHCHDEKTLRNRRRRGTYDKRQVAEEPCEIKVSRTVL